VMSGVMIKMGIYGIMRYCSMSATIFFRSVFLYS
jgi:formate hydrogenlyase subunit 3/multisubunit Na+/H+ antiporter MnhD subunit